MAIKYVVSSMIFWGTETRVSLEQECEFLRSRGLGIELWPTLKNQSDCRYQRCNWPRLTEATKGMLVSMQSRKDEPTIEQWAEQIECADLLGAHIITDLYNFGLPAKTKINGCDFSSRIVEMANKRNVNICIESGDLQRLLEVGNRFPAINYCLNTGKAYLDSQINFRKYVDSVAERIGHIHLNDNYGSCDDHQPPGLAGGISPEDWHYLLKTIQSQRRDIVTSFEIRPPNPEVMLAQAGDFLFNRMDWPRESTSSVDRRTSKTSI